MSTTTNSSKIKYKIAFLGDQGVGKSSIIEKYINNRFNEEANPTIGIDFLAKTVVHKSTTYRLQLWDTAGQQRFKSLIPSYLRDAMCAIIVFDVTNRQSLLDAEKWLRLYNQNKSFVGYSVLVGNKIDLLQRQVSKQQGKKAAAELKISYFELSAKTGENIESFFEHVLDSLSKGKCHLPYENTSHQIAEVKKEEEGDSNLTGHKMTNKGQQAPMELPPSNGQIDTGIVLKAVEQKPKKKRLCC